MSSLAICIFHIKFCAIPCNRSRDMIIKKNLKKNCSNVSYNSKYFCKNVWATPFTTRRDLTTKRLLGKTELQRP